MTGHVKLLRSGNRLVIDPSTPEIRKLIQPQLAYIEKKFYHGYEAKKRKDIGLPVCEEIFWQCYANDMKDRLVTSFGFFDRIKKTLKKAGFTLEPKWATQTEADRMAKKAETVYSPHWDRIDELVKTGFEFRYQQRELLELMCRYWNGRVDCPPGWGKGTSIMLLAKLFPKAKIDVITKNIAVIDQRLYPELALNLPSVGVAHGGKHKLDRRVMCISADSYRYFRPDADFVLVDEGHQACADAYAERLGAYEHARMWSFSASWELRLDGKNLRGESIFGPIRLVVTYQEAEDHGIVVPIRVVWGDVIMNINPAEGLDKEEKKRAAYWANDYRNAVIAKDARRYDESVQTLITVETVEHGLYLQRELPEFKFVYSGQSLTPKDWRWFERQGLLPDGFSPMTEERKKDITRRFEKGIIKKAIATPVWNVGVNFKGLQVLIRADGGASPINDVQIPGRVSRPKEEIEKYYGILHDYRDQFDKGCHQRAKGRERSYARNNWEQISADDAISLLRTQMKWGREV